MHELWMFPHPLKRWCLILLPWNVQHSPTDGTECGTVILGTSEARLQKGLLLHGSLFL